MNAFGHQPRQSRQPAVLDQRPDDLERRAIHTDNYTRFSPIDECPAQMIRMFSRRYASPRHSGCIALCGESPSCRDIGRRSIRNAKMHTTYAIRLHKPPITIVMKGLCMSRMPPQDRQPRRADRLENRGPVIDRHSRTRHEQPADERQRQVGDHRAPLAPT